MVGRIHKYPYTSILVLTASCTLMGLVACSSMDGGLAKRTIKDDKTLENLDIDGATSPETDGHLTYSGMRQAGTPVPSVMQDVSLGRGAFVRPGSKAENYAKAKGGSVELAFDRAPVEQIVNAVIGEILGADFIIDPDVSGEVTLRTAGPVKKADIPAVLSEALSLTGVSLIETGANKYAVVPGSEARRFARTPRVAGGGDAALGADLVIAPLQYVSAAEMARVIQPFTPQGAAVQTDDIREILILSGSPSQIDVLLDTIEMFDVDWLSAMSFGVYETRFAKPETLIEELGKVFGGPTGPIGSQVEFIPLPRLNAVMVIAKRAHRLEQAEEWIRKLDRNVGGEGRRFQFLSIINADAEAIAETISDLLGQGGSGSLQGLGLPQSPEFANAEIQPSGIGSDQMRIRADIATNALIVYGTDEEFRQVQELVSNLDVLPDQVLIEAVIAEVTLNDDLRYGVQWFFDTRDDQTFTFTDANNGAVSSRFPGFAYAFNGNYVKLAINALAAVTDIELISSPQIITLDNQPATLQVGDQVPIVTQSAVSVDNPNAPIVNSVQFRDTGILLTVTPRINDGDMVILEVAQEISNAVPTVTSGIDAPTIQQRRFDSVVSVADGETLALGGLISSTKSVTDTGVPVLKDVPLLGNAFKGQSDNRSRTELVIFMTPRIIRSREDARSATRAVRDRLERLKVSRFVDDDEAR